MTAGSLLRDAFQGLTSLEQGFDRTVIDLLRRPGATVRNYLRGRTRPYTSPLKFAIVAAAVAMIAMHLLAAALAGALYFALTFGTMILYAWVRSLG